jgi:segregation and condensation protein B
MDLKSIIEAILFISDRPISRKELAKLTKRPIDEIEKAIIELKEEAEKNKRGIIFLIRDDQIQMATSPDVSSYIKKFLDYELKEELTPAGLETLSIISYKGPITKEELDMIRGVNCAIILRHLKVKGLIDEIKDESGKILYRLSFDFLRWLGIKDEKELPDYEKFHNLEINFPFEK